MKATQFFILFVFYSCFSDVTAQTVYVTKTGKKFHKSSCHYLEYSKREVQLKSALDIGYSACKVCKPSYRVKRRASNLERKKSYKPILKRRSAVQCAGKTKSGRRCRRKTKSSNGRCYQH